MQTQTSNTLHNAIMEAGSKDRPPMLAPGSPITTTARIHETYKNVSQEIRDQLNAKAEAVQIILTGIDNDIYSTVDACPNACEMWKAIERLKHVYHPQNHPTHYTQNSSTRSQQAATRNRGKAIVNSPQPIYDQEPSMVDEDDDTSKDKEIDKLMDLISLSFKKIYKPTNNNLRTSSNTSRANQDNSLRINRNVGYENQRIGNVVGARETVGSSVVQKSRIQCYNCKEFRHVSRDCQKPKRAKDAAYHREKMLLYMSYDREEIDQNDDDNDLAKEREDGENLDKMKEKGDECIFVGYSNQSRAYRVFNKRTRVIMESIHVNFDELPHMASDHISSDPAPECQSRTITTSTELNLLFSPMFDELLIGSSKVVSKSSADINQAEMYAENDQVVDDEFINIFCTPKWFWKNKRDAQKEGVDFEESFTPVARLEAVSKFEMSMMGELKFFLGIQIHQSPRGIFINQAKYAQEILKKHGMTSCDSIGTPMATKHLDANLSGTPVDQTKYR
nr:retrovirus-related Pol polyprotein from transposon TNT 1-94 [Tanacetum cinerariifolium]